MNREEWLWDVSICPPDVVTVLMRCTVYTVLSELRKKRCHGAGTKKMEGTIRCEIKDMAIQTTKHGAKA